nr:unnamed protein product [Haemonchus contortus]
MPQSKIWSNGELLSTALESGCAQNVRALREAGCPVHPHHLHLLMKCYSSSVFDGLIMEPEYAICHVTENLVTDLTTVRSWSYFLRLLEHFGYKTGALDANLPGKVRTLLEACTDVPGDVQFRNSDKKTFWPISDTYQIFKYPAAGLPPQRGGAHVRSAKIRPLGSLFTIMAIATMVKTQH